MKTFAVNEKLSAHMARKARPYVHHPMGSVQQAQQAAMRKILRPDEVQAKPNTGIPPLQKSESEEPEEELQRQPEEENEEEEPIQAKLIQKQPDNEEESEEALQRQPEEEEEEPVQTKLIQRQAENEEDEEPVQTKVMRQKMTNMGETQVSKFGFVSQEVKSQQANIRGILRSSGVQAKLTIGQPNDKYEQEADRVADQVMAMPDPKLQRQPENEEEEESLQAKPLTDQITPLVQQLEESPEEKEEETAQAKFKDGEMIQRMCPECEEETAQRQTDEEDETLQSKTKPGHTPTVGKATRSKIQSLNGGGHSLPPNQRAFFESHMGYDFSGVRIHDGGKAAESAQAVQAKAFTLGNNIVFNIGQYSPDNQQGKRLLAHELTHVVQQGTGRKGRMAQTKTISCEPGNNNSLLLERYPEKTNKSPVHSKESLNSLEENKHRVVHHNDTHDYASIKIVENRAGTSIARQDDNPPEWEAYGDEYKEYASRINHAVSGLGTDEEAIYEVLQQVQGSSQHISYLKDAYLKQYKVDLVAVLKDEMSGEELDFALALLGDKPKSKELEIRGRTYTEADYTKAVSRLQAAMTGPGTNEEAIFVVLLPFSGAFSNIKKLKDAYYKKISSGLEDDIRSELSGSELAYALNLLQAPLLPAKGMSEIILRDAERETSPGGACTIVSMRRYVRTYIDYHYLDGRLLKLEDLKKKAPDSEKYNDLRGELKTELEHLLNADLAEQFLDGGPETEVPLRDALRHENVLHDYGRRMHLLWQITSNLYWPGTEKQFGATEALATGGKYKVKVNDTLEKIAAMFGVSVEDLRKANRAKLKPTADAENAYFLVNEIVDIPAEQVPVGERIIHPVTEAVNIHDLIWEEVLKPGAIIQIWSNQAAADAYGCVAGAASLGGYCGHSFIFVEYVYSTSPSAPTDSPLKWSLYGGSGTPINTGGDNITGGTYKVARGNSIEYIADLFAIKPGELKKLNEDKLKPNKDAATVWFNTGEIISVPRENKPLTKIKNMYLVGQRIIDQSGYFFIPRDPALRNTEVLPSTKQAKAKWIGDAEVWSATKLV